jgi:hypothetical protein
MCRFRLRVHMVDSLYTTHHLLYYLLHVLPNPTRFNCISLRVLDHYIDECYILIVWVVELCRPRAGITR